MTLKKNDKIKLEITGITAQGSGVGRTDGLAVFVPFTAIGDEIVCHIVKVKPSHAYGRVDTIIKASPDRNQNGDDGCSVFGRCGGCVWRHIGYDAELKYKRQIVADALLRIGGIDIEPRPIAGADSPEGYRNKAQYPVARGEHRPLIGFYAPRSHRVVEQHNCRLQPPLFADIVDTVARWAKKYGVEPYDEVSGKGLLRHIYIRRAEATDQVMAGLVCTSGKIPHADILIDALKSSVPGLASLMVNLNREKTNVILGNSEFVLWGRDYITDELCGLRFNLSMRSFYQVNRCQAQRLYTLAAEAATLNDKKTVLDLYCGAGTIGLSMANRVKQVIGVEILSSAVEDAIRNAEQNGIKNARFICADAAEAASRLKAEGVKPDVVILDPPRKGCDEQLIATVAGMSPESIVYVSCDPATLARDLKRFDTLGYKTQTVTPVDMFPRTEHVECVVLMSRVEK